MTTTYGAVKLLQGGRMTTQAICPWPRQRGTQQELVRMQGRTTRVLDVRHRGRAATLQVACDASTLYLESKLVLRPSCATLYRQKFQAQTRPHAKST